MLGSYATVELDQNSLLGVIAIQDEAAALVSVSEMRAQTLFISLLAAALALLIGFYFAEKLTRPVRELAAGAQRIAAGDFSQRVKVLKSRASMPRWPPPSPDEPLTPHTHSWIRRVIKEGVERDD